MTPDNDQQLRDLLNERLRDYGAAIRFAQDLGIAPSHLSEMRNGWKPISVRVAEALGFRPVCTWVALD